MSDDFTLKGYEDLEISTQILIRDALKRGVAVDVLDRRANFLALRRDGRTEYVKQATKTSKDSYITYLIMENKSVTKQLLQAEGLRVPAGEVFDSVATALQFLQSASWPRAVVKPNATNFGLGISIIDTQSDSDALLTAIESAFTFGETVIVEEFVDGGEYRFLVIDSQTVAVCQRVPANVVGDGASTVGALVEAKNRDPRRARGYITPLETIVLGDFEQQVLREDYAYDIASVPGAGETVYLRHNSNISTGGDSIDVTDSVHESYKAIARRAAACVGAKICGVDMILPDPTTEDAYAILELNFNPVLYIHDYPFEGTNRQVGEKVLDLLGF